MRLAELVGKVLDNPDPDLEDLEELLNGFLTHAETTEAKNGLMSVKQYDLNKIIIRSRTMTYNELKEDNREYCYEGVNGYEEVQGYVFTVFENLRDKTLPFCEYWDAPIKMFFMPASLDGWFNVSRVLKKKSYLEFKFV